MLHGIPGTGKTSYIRYLVGNISKKMIFIPTNYSEHIASPEFIALLSNHPNSILVIEDAENILSDRDGINGKAVSNLLNISDGILSDCLNIQIICTFNTDLKKIDPALLRKGRIIAKYQFKALEVHKAKLLSKNLGFKVKINSPATLAEIYNPKDIEIMNKANEIGFKLKKELGDGFYELRTIINKHDPIGLIQSGAPEDEYDAEVKTIIIQIVNGLTKEQIHDIVFNEFSSWFNFYESIVGPKDKYHDLAVDIYN